MATELPDLMKAQFLFHNYGEGGFSRLCHWDDLIPLFAYSVFGEKTAITEDEVVRFGQDIIDVENWRGFDEPTCFVDHWEDGGIRITEISE